MSETKKTRKHPAKRQFRRERPTPETEATPVRDIPVVEASPGQGLTDAQVQERREGGCRNVELESASKSFGEIVRSNVCTYFNLIFFVLAVAVCAVGAWAELTFIIVVVANICIGIGQEWKS
ncbi:MAG: cation-translocating P-type ATPase, partial [Clostridiales bacterium]|nr:cation-translocating P-type ATPase [Clostridiales bacterium]